MYPQSQRSWSYSEMIGAMLRQERQDQNPALPESAVEQLARQLGEGLNADEIELDLSTLVQCPECEPDLPCPSCRSQRVEMVRLIRDHLRRIQASGGDPLLMMIEGDHLHSVWQHRFEQLHLATLSGESLS